MKTGKLSIWVVLIGVAAASCTKPRVDASNNPYRNETFSSSESSPGENNQNLSARDIIRQMEVSEDFYRTEEEMWEEHEDNLRRVERKYRRIARLRRRPQYSNPEYYGHRRKPKIRPVGKRKLCDECGIWH